MHQNSLQNSTIKKYLNKLLLREQSHRRRELPLQSPSLFLSSLHAAIATVNSSACLRLLLLLSQVAE